MLLEVRCDQSLILPISGRCSSCRGNTITREVILHQLGEEFQMVDY
jgi:Fe-S cluster biogenesis protein NfuA